MYIGVYPLWYEKAGGGAEDIQKFAELMTKKGHEVHLGNSVFKGKNMEINYHKLNYVRIPFKNILLYPRPAELEMLISKMKPDIIHHFIKYGFSTEQLRKKRKIKVPTINSVISLTTPQVGHSCLGLLIRGKLISFLSSLCEIYSLKNADRVIATTYALAKAISRESKIPLDKISIIPRGIDIDKFKRQSWSRVERNLILFAGRLEETKGVEYIIKSMKYILREVPDAKLTIAGDGQKKEEFKKLAEEIAPKKVEFLGKVPHDEMSEWYARCNVFVMHSRFEGFGAVTVEAMASARPVVASRTGGSIDIVKNNETGILVKFGDVKGIADAIVKILKDEELAKRMGERGRKRVEREYSWEKVIESVEKLYRELL